MRTPKHRLIPRVRELLRHRDGCTLSVPATEEDAVETEPKPAEDEDRPLTESEVTTGDALNDGDLSESETLPGDEQ